MAAVAPAGNGKTSRALRARRGIVRRYEAWGSRHRDSSRPLLWIHAPSVGEGLQAEPVIELYRARHPETQVVYTFFSPSAERFANGVNADFHDYLPFDSAHEMKRAVAALSPSAIVFSKLDVWPVLVECAARRIVKLGMLSATMPASSLRHSAFARLVLHDAYASLNVVGAVSDPDALRLMEAGVQPERIIVTGDTRYDQAWIKAESETPERSALLRPLRTGRFTMVAGSTWPSDEKRLLPAWNDVRKRHPNVRLVIAPHEISEKHLDSIQVWARDNALSAARLDDASVSSADVIIVSRYGALGDLYALADIAYVGGGFRRAGLHSLLEPAAFGVPVIIGPRHADNRDARLLVVAGGAFRCRDSGAIASQIMRWVDSPVALSRARDAARETVRAGLGAAERSFELVEGLVGARAIE
ncbi:MAG: 3-deoxy-D-manno-octulosonic acid transferase [Gemmatimonadaceae bacterium]